jgi:hypothetical protein
LALEAKDRDSGLAFAMEIQWIDREFLETKTGKFPPEQANEIHLTGNGRSMCSERFDHAFEGAFQ